MFTLHLIYLQILLSTIHVTLQYAQQIPELCASGSVDSASKFSLSDNTFKLFISSGNHFWLLNVTGEIPNEHNVQHLPYNFNPDVALFKDSTGCLINGNKTLLLIEMKHSWDGRQIEWNTIQGWIDGEDLNWGPIEKIGFCDKFLKTCNVKNDYFAQIRFNWEKKLDSAFGIIGQTAYFVQEGKVYKVHYRNRCITDPYKEIVSYEAFNLETTTTAAMEHEEDNNNNNFTITFFDRDMFYNFTTHSLRDVVFDDSISDGSLWKTNRQQFFDQCPKIDSVLDFLAFDFFGSSSKHFSQKPMILFMLIILILLILIAVTIVAMVFLLRSHSGSPSGIYEITEDGLMSEESNGTKLDSMSDDKSKEKKTFLQTSC